MVWLHVSPERLVVHQLRLCNEFLVRALQSSPYLLDAAKATHVALQAALTAALAGSDGTGAFKERERIKWLAYLSQLSEEPRLPVPDDWVMAFGKLVETAQKEGRLGQGPDEAITLSKDDDELLKRLYWIRHAVEHPKPGMHSFPLEYIVEAVRPALRLVLHLVRHQALQHHFTDSEHACASSSVEGALHSLDALAVWCATRDEEKAIEEEVRQAAASLLEQRRSSAD